MSEATAREKARVLGVACVVLAAQIAVFHGVRLDDGYVSFRYGANLSRGAGFVFNPGERVMGSTSPGECLLAALVFALTGPGPLPSVMSALGCVGWTAQALAAWRIARPYLGAGGAGLLGAAIALGAARSAAWVPLETNVTAGFALFAIERALARRYLASAALCGVATIFRPDACLLAIPLVVLVARALGRGAWRPVALYAAVVAPWALFATAYFGSPIPRSALVKLHATPLAEYASLVFRTVPVPFPAYEGLPWPAFVPMWGAAIAGAYALARRDLRLAVLPAWGALHLAVYVLVLRSGATFAWHLYPACVAFVVCVTWGLVAYARTWSRALAAGYVAFGALGTLSVADEARHGFWYEVRDAIYRDVATWLDARAEPGDALSCEEAGTLGWYTPLVINDQAGLVTPDPYARFHDFLSGRPTRLRWVVLNGQQLGTFASVARGRTLAAFQRGDARLWVVDLREARDPALGP